MEIQNIRFDHVPMIAIDRGNGYVCLCCELGADTIMRLEQQIFDRLVELGRIEVIE